MIHLYKLTLCYFLFVNIAQYMLLHILHDHFESTSQCMITFKFSQEEICHGTNITINEVQKCPENAKTVQMRIIERKCYQYPKCDGEVLVYHCTRFLNNLIEVCSPNGLITG